MMVASSALGLVGFDIGRAQRSEVVQHNMNGDIRLTRGQRNFGTYDATLHNGGFQCAWRTGCPGQSAPSR